MKITLNKAALLASGMAILVAAASFANMAQAQQRRTNTTPTLPTMAAPNRPIMAPNAASATQLHAPDAAPVVWHNFTPAPVLVIIPGMMANMDGWSKLTNGAVSGSPAFVRTSNGTALVARGGDHGLYTAPLNSAGTAVDETKWAQIAADWPSDRGVSCATSAPMQSIYLGMTNSCYGINGTGAAITTTFRVEPVNFGTSYGITTLGGHDAGGLPQAVFFPLVPAQYSTPNLPIYALNVYADGHLFRRGAKTSGTVTTYSTIVPVDQPWAQVAGVTEGSAAACAPRPNMSNRALCATNGGSNYVHVFELVGASAFNDQAWALGPHSPAANGNLTSPPAIVVHPNGFTTIVARGGNGHLMRIVYNSNGSFTSWTDEGGFLAQGTQPSCLADGAVPVCVIAGPDGAAYARRLPAAGGL